MRGFLFKCLAPYNTTVSNDSSIESDEHPINSLVLCNSSNETLENVFFGFSILWIAGILTKLLYDWYCYSKEKDKKDS